MFPSELINLFEQLEIREYSNRWQGACPIHHGDNPSAFFIYKESGVWQCATQGCHEHWGCGVSGLCDALKIEYTNLEDYQRGYRRTEVKEQKPICTTSQYREKISQLPSKYYLERGYSEFILKQYDVGACFTQSKILFNRATVPIFNHDHKEIIGITGRDLTGKSRCKWLHVGFEKNHILYNSWFARHAIRKTKTAIIVEGPGDVWKLSQAGIKNGLAILGTSFSKPQRILLSRLGVQNLVLLLDNDEAGKKTIDKVQKICRNLYNILVPEIEYKDVGECPEDYLKQILSPR